MYTKKRNRTLIIILAIIIFVIMFPVIVTCGAPGYACTSGLNENGKISRTSDVEPFIIYILESASHEDASFKYFEFSSEESI